MHVTLGNCESELHKLWKESIHYSGTTSFKVFEYILGQQYALEVRTSVGFVLSGILGSHIKTKNYSKFKPDMNLASKVLENSLKYIKVVENNISDIEKVWGGEALKATGPDSVCQYCQVRGLCRKGMWS
jgi:hypothetical protein